MKSDHFVVGYFLNFAGRFQTFCRKYSNIFLLFPMLTVVLVQYSTVQHIFDFVNFGTFILKDFGLFGLSVKDSNPLSLRMVAHHLIVAPTLLKRTHRCFNFQRKTLCQTVSGQTDPLSIDGWHSKRRGVRDLSHVLQTQREKCI